MNNTEANTAMQSDSTIFSETLLQIATSMNIYMRYTDRKCSKTGRQTSRQWYTFWNGKI